MKKILLILLLCPFLVKAQLGILKGGNNNVKVNVSSLLLRNYNITYERHLLSKLSISVGYRWMPKGQLPFVSSMEKIINDPQVHVSDFQMGNNAITIEPRLYLGAGKMKGFYIAPYLRIASFDLTIPVNYTDYSSGNPISAEAKFDGKIKSVSGGLLLGTQYRIGKKFVLDMWIIGGHYGSSNGNLDVTFPGTLDAKSQESLQTELDKHKEVGPFKFTSVVSANVANIQSTGPWAGLRGGGINLGFNF